jgi:hypothetical protein
MRSGLTSSSRQQQTLNFTVAPVGASATTVTLGLYYTGNISVTWNPGIISDTYSTSSASQRVFANTYVSTGATGTIRGNVNLIRKIISTGTVEMYVPASETAKLHSLAEFSASSTPGSAMQQIWEFDVSSLPPMMTYFNNGAANTSFGSIGSSSSTNLPAGIQELIVGGANTITGDISNLPSGMQSLSVSNTQGYSSPFQLSGNINTLPPNMEVLTIQGNLSAISGDIANLSSLSVLRRFTVYGSNTINGDILRIPSLVETFNVRGNNTLSGNIANIPLSVTYFYVSGANSISGDISTLKPSLTTCYLFGNNTLTGELGSLALACPSITTFSVYGVNQINGNIVDLPSALSNINMYGYNTIGGNIADIKPAMRNLVLRSFGTITGNINTIPNGLTQLLVSALTGNIFPGPSAGTNTIFGDLADIPNSVNYFYLGNGSGALTYTGKTWPTMDYFAILPKATYGLTQSQVNALLIDLAAATWDGGSKVLYLAGSNAAPDYGNSTVTAAIATLLTKVNTLTIN